MAAVAAVVVRCVERAISSEGNLTVWNYPESKTWV